MKTKNICVITDHYPINGYPMYTFLEELVNSFAKQGMNCFIITPSSITKYTVRKFPLKPKYEKREITKGLYTYVFSPRYFSFSNIKIDSINFSKLTLFSFYKSVHNQFKKLIKETTIDVIYAHFIFPSGIVASRLSAKYGIPAVLAYGENTLYTIEPLGVLKTKKELESIKKVVAVSTKNKQVLIENNIFNENQIKVFLNGVNFEKIHPISKSKARKILNFPENKFIVCTIGGFSEIKGTKILCNALNSIDDENVCSVFIGTGNIKPNHKNMLFCDSVDHKDIYLYLSASDVFILPSLAEGLSNAIVEALVCGLPIIASDLPFNYDILNHNNSILINPLSENEIKNAILYLYNNHEISKELGSNAKKTGMKLDVNARAKNILEFIFLDE